MTTEVQDYPADWDVTPPSTSAYLNKKSFDGGVKHLLRIAQGPMAIGSIDSPFKSGGFDLPDPKEPGKTVKRYNVRVPFGFQVPGWYTKAVYVFEVIMLTGPDAGKHLIWEANDKIKEQMQNAMARFKAKPTELEFEVYKSGEGTQTRWFAAGGPVTHTLTEQEMKPQFNLREKIKFATKEELDALPPPPEDKKKPITKALVTQILDLVGAKDVTDKQLAGLIKRKTGDKKSTIDELLIGEAQEVIEVLKAM